MAEAKSRETRTKVALNATAEAKRETTWMTAAVGKLAGVQLDPNVRPARHSNKDVAT